MVRSYQKAQTAKVNRAAAVPNTALFRLTGPEPFGRVNSRLKERAARPGRLLKSMHRAARSKGSNLLKDGKDGGCASPELEVLRFGRQPSVFSPIDARFQ